MSGCLIVDSDDERSVAPLDYTGIPFFIVPYDRKDEAKKLGARWNPDEKKWYAEGKAVKALRMKGFKFWVFHKYPGCNNDEVIYDFRNIVYLKQKWDLCEDRDCRLCQEKQERHPSWCPCDWCSNPE